MNRDDVVNGYRILTEPTNAGGGMSRWSFAERDGGEYFLKMFLAPRYPLPELPGSEEVKAHRRAVCERFERRHLEIARRLDGDLDGGANLVIPRDFFRVGATYVKVMDRVRPDPLPSRDGLSDRQVVVLLRTLCVALRVLHRQGIVHGDLKPDNVMTQLRGEVYIAKLIDFDEAYLDGDPPEPKSMVGDPAYYAPEHLAYVKGLAPADDLGLSADMFALGLLFHILLVGALPRFDPGVATYPCEVLLNGGRLGIGPVPAPLADVVVGLLDRDPAARPTVDDVIELLLDLDPATLAEPGHEVPYEPPTVVEPPRPVEDVAPTAPPTPPPPPVPSTASPSAPSTPPPPTGRGLRSTMGRRRAPDDT